MFGYGIRDPQIEMLRIRELNLRELTAGPSAKGSRLAQRPQGPVLLIINIRFANATLNIVVTITITITN